MSISTISELRDEIRLLEDRRATQLELIKEDFGMVVESLRPANILKNSVGNMMSSPKTIRNILIAVGGIVIAVITKKSFTRTKRNPFRKLIVTIIQAGLASLLTVKGQDLKQKLYTLFKTSLLHRKQEQYE